MGNKVTAFKEKLKNLNPFRDEWAIDDIDTTLEPYVPLPVRILERKDWGAKKPKWRQKLKTPVSHYVMRFFSDTDYCWDEEECIKLIRGLQDQHMKMGMPDIAWNFIIGGNGTVYEGRGWTTKSTKTDYQTLQYDGETVDVTLMGDFKYYHPLLEMNQAMCRLMRTGVYLGHATEGWELTEVADVPPHAPWTPEYFMKNDLPSERIYDETTEPPPSAVGGPTEPPPSAVGGPTEPPPSAVGGP